MMRNEKEGINMYQIWMRSWETMEYTQPIYIKADSASDALDRADEMFRLNGYQVKSVFPEGQWIEENED